MSRRLPSLNALRAFEAAARHVSFTLAAAELNVTHAAISRHIRELEADLGIKLFHRTGRGVALTDGGRDFAAEVAPAFELLAAACMRFDRPRGRQHLVISAEVPFAALWLVPRLGAFTTKHPKIDLEIDPDNRLVDFSKNEAHLGIRYGQGHWRDVDSVKVCSCAVSPVCSPALAKSLKITSAGDLSRATLLQDETKQLWPNWLKAAGAGSLVSVNGPTLKGHLVIPAAEAGQGFALADDILAGDALLKGSLVRPFSLNIPDICDCAYYLVRRAGSKETAAEATFREWLMAEMARFEKAMAALPRPSTRPRSMR